MSGKASPPPTPSFARRGLAEPDTDVASIDGCACCHGHHEMLPADRLERVWSWGMSSSAMGYVYRPSTREGVQDVFALARERGVKAGMRGAGCSYGDAATNAENITLALSRMRRILAWDPTTGVITVEPGVTIQQVWQYAIEDGWWPYVVSGTMFPTIGGAAAMNIHGKNNFAVGTIGDHIREFEILLPSGEIRICSRDLNADLFHAAIGGFGMLGCFLSLTLELKRVHSGLLRVEPISTPNLAAMFDVFEERVAQADYLVGWVDCFATGESLGRGLIHQANYLALGEDAAPAQTLRVENQELPDTFLFGLLPKSIMWRFMKPFVNHAGMRLVNAARYHSGRLLGNHHVHTQSHAGFAFLLDYVPNWKRSYLPGGLIQYQSFIPKEHAREVFTRQIELQHRHGLPSYLGVFKRHRPDPFLLTHAVDGYSLAFDFKVTNENRQRLWALAAEMDKLVLDSGGRFYFAKDSTLAHARLDAYLQEPRFQKFQALKAELDPDSLLESDLYRRVFGK
jgi:decaprenylphospho-beta-D-ribofuranose 2-oxidase